MFEFVIEKNHMTHAEQHNSTACECV